MLFAHLFVYHDNRYVNEWQKKKFEKYNLFTGICLKFMKVRRVYTFNFQWSSKSYFEHLCIFWCIISFINKILFEFIILFLSVVLYMIKKFLIKEWQCFALVVLKASLGITPKKKQMTDGVNTKQLRANYFLKTYVIKLKCNISWILEN